MKLKKEINESNIEWIFKKEIKARKKRNKERRKLKKGRN